MSTTLIPAAGRLAEHAAAVRETKPLTLPFGRTEAEAVAVAIKHQKIIWASREFRNEEQRIAELERRCTLMCLKDRESGKRLASRAIWGVS